MKNEWCKHELLMGIFLSLTAFLWIVLATIFGLSTYIEHIYFAFDKVTGHFFSLPILMTVFIFLSLLVAYGYFVYFLSTTDYLIQRLFPVIGISSAVSLIAAVFMYPVGALDLFNYVLMGKLVVFYAQNPFIIPFNAVASLDPLQKYAIFLDVTTGYGPLWLVITCLTVLLTGSSSIFFMVLGYKGMTGIFFLLTAWLLYSLPEQKKEKWTAALLYIFNPFIIFEGIVNAHNDILVGFFILLTFWLYKRRHIALFLTIILAGLIKLYALALLPVFVVLVIKEKWKIKEIVLSIVIAGVGLVSLYLPFWNSGKLISGSLLGLQNAQVINGFSPYSLVREFLAMNANPLFVSTVQYSFMGMFLGIFLFLLFYLTKTNDYLHGAISILLAFFLCITIYQPWYVLPVLILLILSKRKIDHIFMYIISLGALFSYPASVWAWFHSGWSTLCIHIFLACFITLPASMYLMLQVRNVILFRSRAQDLR